ncbi:hypothetical protein A3F64_03090 [Candidatus Saccharibacteria bacterium RIFCSPHIGHO2_12_FULL_42_8]|nr:MAG: hypothetical protein A3F64_03090 [Candidatus Saccharibacteria bacterium RIFCSPHIGHO2_12_FULL_42_8]
MRTRGEFTRFDGEPNVLELTETVNKRTSHLSFPEYEYHDEFWRVVDMGEEALPDLFATLLDEETSNWLYFHAIVHIAHDLRLPNIEVPEEARGCYDLVTEAYLKYGVEQGLIKIDKE